MTSTLKCNFPGCGLAEVKPEKALVPKIDAIRQAEGGKAISPDDLAKHVFCEGHGRLGQGVTGGMFPYLKTVGQLQAHEAKRAAQRTAAKQFFAKYGSGPAAMPGAPGAKRPSPRSEVMASALAKAGVATA